MCVIDNVEINQAIMQTHNSKLKPKNLNRIRILEDKNDDSYMHSIFLVHP